MDDRHFDALTRALGVPGSRRTLSTLFGSGLGLLTLAGFGSPDAAAKKNSKKRRKRKQRKKRKKGKGPCGDVCASGCSFSSVQAAIDAATEGDTISLCAGTYGETLSIDKDLTLIGAGDGEDGTILDGLGTGPVVIVASGVTVDLEGVRIIGGIVEFSGGGIDNRGTLTLTGCTVTDNEAQRGGGIGNDGDLTLTDSNVTDNMAGVNGGGIYNFVGTVTLTGCTVTGNEASDSGGGIFNAGTVILINSSVTDNDPDNCAGDSVLGCGS